MCVHTCGRAGRAAWVRRHNKRGLEPKLALARAPARRTPPAETTQLPSL